MHVRVTHKLVPFGATPAAPTLLLYACHRSIVSNYVGGHSLDQQDHPDPDGIYNVRKHGSRPQQPKKFPKSCEWFSPLPITATNCRHNNYYISISAQIEVRSSCQKLSCATKKAVSSALDNNSYSKNGECEATTRWGWVGT